MRRAQEAKVKHHGIMIYLAFLTRVVLFLLEEVIMKMILMLGYSFSMEAMGNGGFIGGLISFRPILVVI